MRATPDDSSLPRHVLAVPPIPLTAGHLVTALAILMFHLTRSGLGVSGVVVAEILPGAGAGPGGRSAGGPAATRDGHDRR